ncbi:MAG TPA: hypothetical protein VIY48_01000 [Candidatus Paceibacterota bacterium]
MGELVKKVSTEVVDPKTYAHVRDLSGWQGVAKVYKNGYGHYVVVSRANTFDRGDETGIFKWDEVNETVSDWVELYFGYGETHQEALDNWSL